MLQPEDQCLRAKRISQIPCVKRQPHPGAVLPLGTTGFQYCGKADGAGGVGRKEEMEKEKELK